MRIYLIRHPRPEVAPGICYGRSDLTVSVREQAAVLASLLPQLRALPPATRIFSSPLMRCATLARQLSAARGAAAPLFDARLAEMDFGAWEMRAWDAIARDEIDAWAADLTGYRPGGGENVLQMAARVQAFHADLARLPFDCAVVVCHAGTIRVSLACRPGRSIEDIAAAAAGSAHTIAYGELFMLDWPQR
ncbi:MAG: histidine phosphatase family protein [Oxalobacteraceae bacterium]|nr:histidine phosphatase family protein [Oxalobacteraceae bacterium]